MIDPKILWEEWNSWGVPNYPHAKVVQFCLRHFPREQRSRLRVLDLGCGSGVNTAFLAGEGFPVTGVDISQNGIDNTRRRLEAHHLVADLHVFSADAVALPSASFDLIVCVGVFDAAGPEVAQGAVGETARLLRPGGRGLFVFASDRDHRISGDNEYHLHGYARADVEGLFARGFQSLHIDRYITTFEGGKSEAHDWLVTLEK